ncbi:MAG: hypothetical protein ABIH40_06570 [Candidatus Omnitrophota bacterium]
MKIINKIILVILLVWLAWVGYQYFTKSETAYGLLEQKVKETEVAEFDILFQKIGKGYEYKVVEIDGQRYWMGWIVGEAGSLPKSTAIHIGRPRSEASRKVRSIEDIDALEARVYIDCIDLLPFGYFKAGIYWVLTIKIKR